MSKEKHTYCKVATNSIVIRKNGRIALNIDTDSDLKTIHFDYARHVVKCLNNHDRVVEALEELINGTNILDARVKAKQLLTELKS